MKTLNILTLVLAIAFISVSASAQANDFDSKLTSCFDLANAKNYPKAIEDCTAAITLKPDDNRAYYYRGIAYLFTNTVASLDAATLDFKKCLTFKPNDSELHYLLGYVTASVINAKPERYEQGIKSYTEAIRLGTDKKTVYFQRGEAYRNAADILTNVLNYLITDSKVEKEANLDKGIEYYKLALADYQKSLEIHPTLDLALLKLGFCQLKTGHPDLAIPTLTKYIEKKPNDKLGYLYRANAYYSLKQFQPALNDADKALELNKTNFTGETEQKELADGITELKRVITYDMPKPTPTKRSTKKKP